MAFGFYSLLEAALLCINAICILHEKRFLSKFGWRGNQHRGFDENSDGIIDRAKHLISSIRTVMRFPLIGLNLFVIVFKLILG